jgi:hypothetical protein
VVALVLVGGTEGVLRERLALLYCILCCLAKKKKMATEKKTSQSLNTSSSSSTQNIPPKKTPARLAANISPDVVQINFSLAIPRSPLKVILLVIQAVYFAVIGISYMSNGNQEGTLYLPLVYLSIYIWLKRHILPIEVRQALFVFFFLVHICCYFV